MEKGPVFGLSIGELLTIYDHDTQSWKMSGCLFTGDYAKYSGALPKSGMMRNGKIYAQATWVPRTKGKESGLWRTPKATDGTNGGPNARDSSGALHLTAQVAKFPTPRANDAEKRDCLPNAVMNYPSPRTRGLCGGSGHKQMLVDKFGEEEGREIFNGGQLNPTWVDWLMGYPIGWTDCADSETRLSLK